MNQLRKNVFLLALFAVLAGALGLYGWFGVLKGEEQERARAKAQARFVPLSGAAPEYVRIVLSHPGGSTTVERQGDAWWIVAPVDAPVDPLVMDTVKSQLDTLELSTVIEEHPTPEDLQRYGLASPAFTVQVTTRPKGGGAKQTYTLEGGGENTFDGSIYVRRSGDPRVYAAPGGVRFNLLRTTLDLRDKQVMKVPVKEVRRVEVTSPRHKVVLEREGRKWRMLEPEATDADAQAVSQFLGGLANERARTFLDDGPGAREQAGLDKPLVEATFTPEKGEPIHLSLGRPEDGPDAGRDALVLMRREGDRTVLAEVDFKATAALDPDPATLRDRSVLAFEKDRVARIEFLKGGSTIVVERELVDGGSLENWRVVAPGKGPAKKFKMTSVLWTLGSLKALQVHDAHPKNWARWGLDRPEQEARLYDSSGNLLAALAVGKPVDGKPDVRYARGTRDQVVEMSTERLVDLPTSLDDVLDLNRAPVADAGAR
ncbi:MAG: DUF4340 domain-containing protein [Myxococcaceae bacterium]|nr:DUF4340 domain-containing protein [Myxococcaceae bacterium]